MNNGSISKKIFNVQEEHYFTNKNTASKFVFGKIILIIW